MSETKFTLGPWSVCHHLNSKKDDDSCPCGYRGVVWGPDKNIAFAVCQPGHDPEITGEEGMGPARYSRDVEIANAHLIAASPTLYAALEELLKRTRFEDENYGLVSDLMDLFARCDNALALARGEVQP